MQDSESDDPVLLILTVEIEKSFVTLSDKECIFTLTSIGFVRSKDYICQQQKPTALLMKHVKDIITANFLIVPPSPTWSFIGHRTTADLKNLELRRHNLELAGKVFILKQTIDGNITKHKASVILEVKEDSQCVCNTIENLRELNISTSEVSEFEIKGREILAIYRKQDTSKPHNMCDLFEIYMPDVRPLLIGNCIFTSMHKIQEKVLHVKEKNKKSKKKVNEVEVSTADTNNLISHNSDNDTINTNKRKSDITEADNVLEVKASMAVIMNSIPHINDNDADNKKKRKLNSKEVYNVLGEKESTIKRNKSIKPLKKKDVGKQCDINNMAKDTMNTGINLTTSGKNASGESRVAKDVKCKDVDASLELTGCV